MDNQARARQLIQALREGEMARWEQLPDIELYMDQVITWLKRQLNLFQQEGENSLVTPSIINNYVKGGIVPRPVKKKYGPGQLAALTMACVLKRTLPMQQVKKLTGGGEEGPDQEAYDGFCQALEDILRQEAQALEDFSQEEDLLSLAMHFALRSSVDDLIARQLLALCRQENTGEEQ